MSIQSKMTAIANAIRAKTGGSASLGLDQMATEIAGLSKPAGTLSITANGTYDVTGKASAAVNVQPSDFRQWTYTSTGTASAAYTTLISGDAWLAANYNNANLVISISPKFVPQPGTSVRSIVFARGSNKPIGYGYREIGGSAGNVYGVFARYGTDAGAIYAYTRNYALNGANDLGDVGVTSGGNLILYAYTGSTYMLQTGDWDITAYIAG